MPLAAVATFEASKALLDSAESCRMSASMRSHASAFHARRCGLCADICKACEAAASAGVADARGAP